MVDPFESEPELIPCASPDEREWLREGSLPLSVQETLLSELRRRLEVWRARLDPTREQLLQVTHEENRARVRFHEDSPDFWKALDADWRRKQKPVVWEPDQWTQGALEWLENERHTGRIFNSENEAREAFIASQRPDYGNPSSVQPQQNDPDLSLSLDDTLQKPKNISLEVTDDAGGAMREAVREPGSDMDVPKPNTWLPVTPDLAQLKIQQQKIKDLRDQQNKLRETQERINKLRPRRSDSDEVPFTPEPGSLLDSLARFGQFVANRLTKARVQPIQEQSVASNTVDSDAARSPTMERFSVLVVRCKSVIMEITHHLMHWDPLAVIIGLVMAGGSFALAVAFVPEKITPALYTIAELSFLIGITLFIAKCAYDFRAHKDRRFIIKIFAITYLFLIVSVIALFELYRPNEIARLKPSEQQDTSPQDAQASVQPDISLRLVHSKDIAIVLVNESDVILREPKCILAVWNLDRQNWHKPLPVPVMSDDWIRAREYTIPHAFIAQPRVAPLIKQGDRLFGIIRVTCPDCVRTKAYWFYAEYGVGGWYAEQASGYEFDVNATSELLPLVRLDPDKFLSDIPLEKRMEIKEAF